LNYIFHIQIKICFNVLFVICLYDIKVNGIVNIHAYTFYFLFNKNVNSWHNEIFSTAFANLTA